jgi:hypothetical protein
MLYHKELANARIEISQHNLVHCLFFSAFIEMLDFFPQEMRPLFSMLNAKGFEIVYVLHHLYIMYSNVKTPSDVT